MRLAPTIVVPAQLHQNKEEHPQGCSSSSGKWTLGAPLLWKMHAPFAAGVARTIAATGPSHFAGVDGHHQHIRGRAVESRLPGSDETTMKQTLYP